MTWTDETLTALAKEIYAPLGYEEVRARICPHAEFKITWRRTSRWIELSVSDYLVQALQFVMQDILEAAAHGRGHDYPPETRKWLMERIRTVAVMPYLERHEAHAGENVDLAGLTPEGCTSAVRFGPMLLRDSAFSLLFDVILINEDLDEPGNEQMIAKLIRKEQENLERARAIY